MYLHCCLYGVLYDMFDVTLYSPQDWTLASGKVFTSPTETFKFSTMVCVLENN